MKIAHIVGRKNNGKTTLMVELIQAFTAQGLRVASIKHSPHPHEPDTPGKDSHQHREAGAITTAFVTPEVIATYTPIKSNTDFYQQLASMHHDIDLLLVEGDLDGPGPKYEVYRASVGKDLIASDHQGITGIITDDDLDESLAQSLMRFSRSDLHDFIEHLIQSLDLAS